MGVVGFVDFEGHDITFEDMRAGAGNWNGVPRAVLFALARNYRPADYYGPQDTVSVTTLVGPVQIARLMQRHEFFVDPLKNLWAALGTSVHAMFEADTPSGDVAEVKLVLDFDGVKIAGTFDLLEAQVDDHYHGKDYKITSAFSVEMMMKGGLAWNGDKSDYFWQAQLYKRMVTDPATQMVVERQMPEGQPPQKVLRPWPLAGKVVIDSWDIVTIIRNWDKRNHSRKFPIPIQVVPIPVLLENHRIDNYLNERVAIWQASDMVRDRDLPECTDEETWQGRRCADWCHAAPKCHQIHPGLAQLEDEGGA